MMESAYNELAKNQELWDIFTRKEEYFSTQLDNHSRFIHQKGKHGIIDRPLVSQYLKRNGYHVDYPEGKSFAICLTHDVDDVFPPLSHIAASSLHCSSKLQLINVWEQISWKIKASAKSPYLNFQKIIDLESKYGAKSTFFFLAGSEDVIRYRYDLKDVENEIGRIVDCGWEVGLHGGYYSFDDIDALSVEKRELEKRVGMSIYGYRGHYLRFKVPDTWSLLSKLGFRYDTTLGYSDAIGFRNGTCYPFEPYDIRCDKSVDILEIPMAIMDGALFCQERTHEGALEHVKSMIDAVESCNGVMVLNWHSNNMLCPFRESWLKIFKNILEYCTKKNAWITNGMEIVQHFGHIKPTGSND